MSSLKLLVVEDDALNLELMQEVLTSLKANVSPVNQAEEAALVVNKERFDGIFIDMEMPRMHGLELAGHIRKSPSNQTTPIVVVTGSEEKAIMQQAFARGVNFFLQKPIDRRKLSGLYRAARGVFLENHRRYVRVPLRTEVICSDGPRTIRGMSWNLSQGGILIDAGTGLKSGDPVRMSFRLPVSNEKIDAMGTVVWTSETRQGIRFTKLSEQNARSLKDFIVEVEQPD